MELGLNSRRTSTGTVRPGRQTMRTVRPSCPAVPRPEKIMSPKYFLIPFIGSESAMEPVARGSDSPSASSSTSASAPSEASASSEASAFSAVFFSKNRLISSLMTFIRSSPFIAASGAMAMVSSSSAVS